MNKEVRKHINQLVSSKMTNRADRLSENGSEDLESAGEILADYDLYFNGMADTIKAMGSESQEEFNAVFRALDTNNAELTLLESKVALARALSDDESSSDIDDVDED